MRYYRKSLKKILDKDMGRIVVVVCPSDVNHRVEYMSHVFWGYGYSLDDPTEEELSEILLETGLIDEAWEIIITPCYFCRNNLPNGEEPRRPHGFETNRPCGV